MHDICDKCGQKIQLAHKETMNKHKLTMLKQAAGHVMATNVNDFALSDLAGETYNYNNWQKLRYHGLIHHATKNGFRHRGRWLITRNGWAFMRGEITISKYVKVRNNHIIEHSSEQIKVQDVYYGSVAIETRFAYFDHETGKMIGYRPAPTVQKSIQTSLI